MTLRHGWGALLILAFAGTRLINLEALPLFLDEALHIVWSGRVLDPGRLERHINDGKLLQVYLFALILPWSSHAAWLARASSAAVGFVGLGCACAIGRRLYGERAAWVAAVLYLVSPYALFYDRMALADIFVSSLSALSLLLTLRLLERPSSGRAFALALSLAAVAFAKMTGVVAAAMPAAAVIVLGRWGALRWLPLVYACYGGIVGVPFYYFAKRAKVYAHVAEAVSEPGAAAPYLTGEVGARVLGEISWLLDYWTWPLLLAAAAGLALGLLRRERHSLLLGLLALLPVASFALVSGHIFPRYLTMSIVPTALLAAAFVERLLARLRPWLAAPLWLALALPAANFDARLLRDPRQAPLPAIERGQYIDGWGAGYGADQAARYISDQFLRRDESVRVVLHRYSERTIHLILRAYLMGRRGLEIVEADLRDLDELSRLRQQARTRPTLVALAAPWENERERFPDASRIFAKEPLLLECRRPGGELVLTLYRLTPPAW